MTEEQPASTFASMASPPRIPQLRRPAAAAPTLPATPAPARAKPAAKAAGEEPATAKSTGSWKGTVIYDDQQREQAQDLERIIVRGSGVRASKGKRMEIILDLLKLAYDRPDLQASLIEMMKARAAAEAARAAAES